MAQALCNLQHKLLTRCGKKGSKRKRCHHHGDQSNINIDEKDCWYIAAQCMGHFPSPKEIACLDEETLNRHCNLGYRASIILEFARNIENGSLNLQDFERPPAAAYDSAAASTHKLFRDRLMKIKGFGPFTVANIMMCIGFYQEIPVDTETIKHLEQV